MKSTKYFPFSQAPQQVISTADGQDLPEVLFARVAHMERFQEYISDALLLPGKKRDSWFNKNQQLLKQMFDRIIEESHFAVRDFAMDPVVSKSVVEYMVVVQQTLAMIERMLNDQATIAD